MVTLKELKEKNLAPEWLTENGYKTLKGGYLLEGETPFSMYQRVAKAAANTLIKQGLKEDLTDKFFEIIWKGWLGLSTPVAANLGTDRALPISCLTGDSIINTPTGGKSIKDIEIGDLVLSHTGRWQKVTNKQVRMSSDDIYELVTYGRTTRLKITGNHPVLTNLGWVKVDELDPTKHLVATNLNAEYEENLFTIDLSKHCPYDWFENEKGELCRPVYGKKLLKRLRMENSTTTNLEIEESPHYAMKYYSQPKRLVHVDEELAWALGLWFAEGSRSIDQNKQPNGLRITLGLHERPIAERWLAIMEEKFGIKGGIYETKRESSWINVNVQSKAVSTWFCEEFGVGCKKKELPLWVLNLPKSQAKCFLDGFYLGDGHIDKNGNYSATISNPQLCLGLYNLALKLGINCKLNLHVKSGVLSTVKHVQNLTLIKFGIPESGTKGLNTHSGIEFDGRMYRAIRSLKKLIHNELVYDITVDTDHSFSVAGVIVHNCYNSTMPDSIQGITQTVTEVTVMSSLGGGTSVYLGDIRPTGTPFGKDKKGKSGGVVPWAKILDSTIIGVSQSSLRRGAVALYLPVDHPDLDDFLRIRLGQGDPNRTCTNVHQAITITDSFMNRLEKGEPEAGLIWKKLMKTRADTGEPYLIFIDTANKTSPELYKKNNLEIKSSNLCLAGDTLVVTRYGQYQIKDLVNKEVEIFDGKNWVKNNKFFYRGKSKVLSIVLKNNQVIRMTPEHRCLVQISRKDFEENLNYVISANELKPGMFLSSSKNFQTEGYKKEKGAYAKGYLFREGLYKDGNIFVNLHEGSLDSEKMLLDSLKELDSNSELVTVSTSKIKARLDYKRIIKKVIKNLNQDKESLLNYLTENQKEETLREVTTWDRESRLKFISGVFDANSKFYSNKNFVLTSISKEDCKHIANILFSLGYKPSITTSYPSKNKKRAPRLCLENLDTYLLFQEGFFQRVKAGDKQPERIFNEWRKIKSIKLEEEEDVYCTTVDTTSYFTLANGILTGNCSEIFLHSDVDHSFVCCLSSLNLDKYDEWKSTDVVELSVYFLDAVMQEFIDKTQNMYGMQRAYNFAVKSRALGLGVLGYHSLLQQKGLPFKSPETNNLNEEIFSLIDKRSKEATEYLAEQLGEPEWCKGSKRRNSNLTALAPTVSNSMICGEVSPGIEPWDSNYFVKGSAKGDLIQKNRYLEKVINSKGFTDEEIHNIWQSILDNKGSVQHLDCLTDSEKETFKTARELDQIEIVKQAGARQKYIDQGQSVNLFFDDPTKIDPNYFSKVHFAAYKLGLKSLYYCRSKSKLKGNVLPSSSTQSPTSTQSSTSTQSTVQECSINSKLTGESCSACEG